MVIVRLVRNWKWPDLMQQTPGHTGKWGDIQFTEEPVEACDYLVILNNLEEDLESLPCPRENVWRIVQEPPTEIFKPWHVNPLYSTRTFTCDPGLSQPQYIRSHPMVPWHVNRDYEYLAAAPIPKKTKLLSWITSTKTFLGGHKRRMRFLEAISGKIAELDVLGTRVIHITKPEAKKKIADKQRELGFKFVEDKWAGLAPYTYSLAIENHSGPDYWTEKIADCFLTWTIPIYYGCTNLEDYFPPESFIRIDIENPEQALAEVKRIIKEDNPEARLPALEKARDLVLNTYQLFPYMAGYIRSLPRADAAVSPSPSRASVWQRGKKKPEISVVVCTYNRAQMLRHCLKSLADQRADKELYEVLVIDNNSKDNTQEVANEFVKKYSNFKLIFEQKQGLSHARNIGYKTAASEYIAYIDDDAQAPEEWIETAINIIDNYEPDIFGGPSLPPDITGLPTWFKANYRVIYNVKKKYGWINEGIIAGCNFFIKKSLLVEYGGFDPNLGMTSENIRFHEETVILFRAYKEKRKVYFHYDLGVNHAVQDYITNVAYFIFRKYQLAKEKYHLFNKTEFGYSDLYDLLNHMDAFFQDFENALRKRDKEKYPYPENYIIQHTLNYIPFIVDRLEYYKSKKKLHLIFSEEIKELNDLDFISEKIVDNKKVLALFFKILIKKIKLFFKKFKINLN